MVNQQRTTRVQYFAGLDLGQAQQFTALEVLEENSARNRGNPYGWTSSFAVRHLERFAIRTPYPYRDPC